LLTRTFQEPSWKRQNCRPPTEPTHQGSSTIARFFHNFAGRRSQATVASRDQEAEVMVAVNNQVPLSQLDKSRGTLIRRVFAVGAATVAAFLVLVGISRGTSQAQTRSQAKNETEMPGNLPKDVAAKDERKGGRIDSAFYNTRLDNGVLQVGAKGSVDISEESKFVVGGDGRVSESDVVTKRQAHLEGVGDGVYLIFKKGIVAVFEKNGKPSKGFIRTDGDELFTYEATICVSEDGSIVVTSPTNTLIMGLEGGADIKYKISLIHPEIFASANPEFVYIRDKTIEGQLVKVSVKTGKYELVDDGPPNNVPAETPLWRERADTIVPVRIDSTVPVPYH
jgi:hypothetical protein